MLTTIHFGLALVSAIATALVAAEAGLRASRAVPATRTSRWLSAGQIVAVVVTGAVGFALIASGVSSGNGLHYLLAMGALLSVPVAPMFTTNAGPRGRAAATTVAALVALVFVALLFATG